MSYVDKSLLNGEAVNFRTHLHWRIFIVPMLVALVVCVPATVMLFGSDYRAFALIPIALIALLVLVPYATRQSSEFVVTNKRVIIKIGLLRTRSLELFLSKVEGIAVNQGLGGKLLNYGDIVITGSGGTKEMFAEIQDPLAFRKAVQEATDRVRDRNL